MNAATDYSNVYDCGRLQRRKSNQRLLISDEHRKRNGSDLKNIIMITHDNEQYCSVFVVTSCMAYVPLKIDTVC